MGRLVYVAGSNDSYKVNSASLWANTSRVKTF